MALTTGSRLTAYDVLEQLGAGGMGEVYRAKDTKLGRDVALKILPASFTNDPERVARFRREAQVLASLNHPHIGQIYGLEETNGTQFLVLELVDGESLDKRIARGPIPVDEALGIAKQIAEALEAAHEKGIIHRDLKPANIALTKDSQVKVLDFGLARPIESTSGSFDLANSPTITSPAMMTGVGVILGTAAYMAPEQAKGRQADRRSDMWSFGCVLFEMVTGKRPFDGEDVSEVLAAVLRAEPDWSALPADTSPALGRCLTRCLSKDCSRRIADASVVLFLLGEPDDSLLSLTPRRRVHRAWMIGMVIVSVAALLVAASILRSRVEPHAIARLQIAAPEGGAFYTNPFDSDIALSPDGSRVVFVGMLPGAPFQLFVRDLNQIAPVPLSGTQAARGPFFSPDGEWIGFSQNNDLKRVSVHGGPPVTLCRGCGAGFRGASWGADDSIVFCSNGGNDGVRQVSASGGDPVTIVAPDAGGTTQYIFPEWIQNRRAVMFSAINGTVESGQVIVRDMRTGTQTVVVRGGTAGRYVPGGYLLYAAEGTLRAVRFDPVRMAVSSNPVPVVEHVATKPTGGADFAVAANGSLMYLAGDWQTFGQGLSWVDRNGHDEPIPAPRRNFIVGRLSHDDARLALDIRDTNSDLWLWDFGRGTLARLTFDPAPDQYPVWSADDRQVYFTSSRTGARNVFSVSSDGTGRTEQLTKSARDILPNTVTPDGKWLVAQLNTMTAGWDLVLVSLQSDHTVKPLLQTPFSEFNADISPDGKWLAYQSTETGRDEVYVRPFPDVETGRWQVSTTGGSRPIWSHTGRELFYVSEPPPEGDLMSTAVDTAGGFRVGNPQRVVKGPIFRGSPQRTYDVAADGRFVVIRPAAASQADSKSSPPQLNVVLNWVDELKTKIK